VSILAEIQRSEDWVSNAQLMQKFSGAYSQQILAQFSIQELCGVVQSSDTQELTQHHVLSSDKWGSHWAALLSRLKKG
jgi:hypothetical protein